jgi:hypothetical protein
LRNRLFTALNKPRVPASLQEISLTIGPPDNSQAGASREVRGYRTGFKETSSEGRAHQYRVRKPLYTFAQLLSP